MINVIDLLCGLNTVILLIICGVYLKNNYVIMTKKDYDTIANYIEATQQEEPTEQVGGVGFFKEYIEEDNED